MIRDQSRSSQRVTPAPLPGGDYPNSSSPRPPKEFPSGPAQARTVLCPLDMELDPNTMPSYGAINRTRRCASGLRSAPLPSVRRQRSRNCPAAAPVRICTTLHYFAPLCSDFGAGPHFKALPRTGPSCLQHLASNPAPQLCRSIFAFWHSFGTVLVQFSPLSTLNFSAVPKLCRSFFAFRSSFGTVLAQFSPVLALSTFNSLVKKPQKIDFR